MFTILKKDKTSNARLGVLRTPHGTVQTPSYVFVGTYGRILHLSNTDIQKTGAQMIIANTFHLWGKKHTFKLPLMTDSGGFQVLSLAFDDKNKVGKFMTGQAAADKNYKRTKIKVSSKGVKFLYDGTWRFLGPELSMKLQKKIGADIIFAFDQITSPLDTYAYNKKAVTMTDRWAKICLKTRNPKQMLYGIVQGGLFKDLRIKSAKSIGSMSFDGFGIGGSYTKEQIADMLKWVIPHLPEEKPRHLLGVGKVADIFEAIDNGVDTFDCVIPTREARHGRLYTRIGHMDIRKGKYVGDRKTIEKSCGCLTCSSKISRHEIRKLIKNDDRKLNAQGQRWCLMHNMWFFNNLLEEIRAALSRGSYQTYKRKTLTSFASQKN